MLTWDRIPAPYRESAFQVLVDPPEEDREIREQQLSKRPDYVCAAILFVAVESFVLLHDRAGTIEHERFAGHFRNWEREQSGATSYLAPLFDALTSVAAQAATGGNAEFPLFTDPKATYYSAVMLARLALTVIGEIGTPADAPADAAEVIAEVARRLDVKPAMTAIQMAGDFNDDVGAPGDDSAVAASRTLLDGAVVTDDVAVVDLGHGPMPLVVIDEQNATELLGMLRLQAAGRLSEAPEVETDLQAFFSGAAWMAVLRCSWSLLPQQLTLAFSVTDNSEAIDALRASGQVLIALRRSEDTFADAMTNFGGLAGRIIGVPVNAMALDALEH